MSKYCTGVWLVTYETKDKAMAKAEEVSAEWGVDVPIFKQVDTVTAVKDEEA